MLLGFEETLEREGKQEWKVEISFFLAETLFFSKINRANQL